MAEQCPVFDQERTISPIVGRRNSPAYRTILAMTSDIAVVICTRDRPELLRRAIAAIAAQTFPGSIETVVVFDRSEPDPTIEVHGGNRPVRVLANDHTPGLPGGRNAGVAATDAPLVSFCDDDDVWYPEKAARQILAAVESNKRRALIGPDAKVIDLISRLPAGLYQRVLARGAKRRG